MERKPDPVHLDQNSRRDPRLTRSLLPTDLWRRTLVEVAALPVRVGVADKTTAGAWLVRPERPVTSRATSVHGLTNAVLASAPCWADIVSEVHTFLGSFWVCAHNAHVDYRAVKAHLPAWKPSGVLDTLRLSRATFPGLPGYSLDHLIEHLKPDLSEAPAQRHRATFDAFATAQLLIIMAKRYETWDQVVVAAVPPTLPGAPQPEPDLTLW
ncbi:3'-5' exonuclease [Streptomyces sp. NBC_01023]|uniref:3'-5' exonuclease n=1 Tax=Streptomyces sp. NBC_01023 TaxID=2903724 RepID=UPI00386C47B6|nr:3'-5' exonuclease [Streptomyces sp. NBC_01023]